MNFDYSKLRGRIIAKFGNYSNFAKRMEINPNCLSRKLLGTVGITPKEIIKWSEVLEIPNEEIGEYFFTVENKKGREL